MSIGIYYIKNKVTGKYYVGQSLDVENRWKRHVHEFEEDSHHNRHLQNSWKKYGKDAFEFKLIKECDPQELNYFEKIYIDKYDSFKNGYNSTTGGDTNWKVSDETKKLLSERFSGKNHPLYGKKHSIETRRKISQNHHDVTGENNPFYGKHHSPDTIKKIKEHNTGLLVGEKHPMWGKHHSDETKKKISKANKGRVMSDEFRKKISNAVKGKNHPLYGKRGKDNPRYGQKHTEETKRKISEANKGRKLSNEQIEKIRKFHTGLRHDNDAMIKMSKNKSTTGFFRVHKSKNKKLKMGFGWTYAWYDETGTRKILSRVDLLNLKEAVTEKGLDWIVIDENLARKTCKEHGIDFDKIK